MDQLLNRLWRRGRCGALSCSVTATSSFTDSTRSGLAGCLLEFRSIHTQRPRNAPVKMITAIVAGSMVPPRFDSIICSSDGSFETPLACAAGCRLRVTNRTNHMDHSNVRPIRSVARPTAMYRFLSTASRKKLNLDTAGRRNIAGSWDVIDADADASKVCCEPAKREVQVPLDVRVVRGATFQLCAFDANIDIRLSLHLLSSRPSCIRGKVSSDN